MAGKKISDLTNLGAAPASNDVVPIVDSSGGATKKVTIEDLFTNPDVTGTLTADGLTVQKPVTGRSTLAVLTNTASLAANNQATLQLKNSGQSAFISGESVQANFGMDLVFSSNDGGGTETTKLRLAENGDISFYEDTGTTAKFFWDASAESLGIGTTSPEKLLHLKTSEINTALARIESTATNSYPTLSLKNDAREYQLTAHGPLGDVFTIYDGTAGSHRLVVDASGNVGIGTTSPSETLHLKSANPVIRLEDSSPDGIYAQIDGAGGSLILSADQGNGNANSNIVFKSDNSEKMRIDSAGNVGIGTTAPNSVLQIEENVANGDGAELRIINDSSAVGTGQTATLTLGRDFEERNFKIKSVSSDSYGLRPALVFTSNQGTGSTHTEAMRIDSSGNLLVGTTSSTLYDGTSGTGFSYRAGNELTVARSGASVATFVRQSDDGGILSLKKDGSAVGSIGVGNSGTDLVIDATRFSNRAGLRFRDSSLYPRQNATDADGLVDLGGSAARFKDLYLSGGAYLGGITSANLLDDYEEGTWTPTIVGSVSNPTVTYTENSGTYTKVGNLVTVACYVDIATYSGGSGSVVLSGLPFVSNATSAYRAGGVVTFANGWTTAPIALLTIAGQITAVFRDGNQSSIDVGDVGAGDEVRVVLSYFV